MRPYATGTIRPAATPVDHYRAPILMRVRPWALLVGIVLAWLVLIFFAVGWVTARHESRILKQAECDAKLENIYLRNPVLRKGRVKWADPCAELRAMLAAQP